MRAEKVEMRPVLKYPGSKWKMAEWIISLMPPHKSYLEPFFGSGAVFFKKEPSRIETINDMDGEIVNLFRCIREEPEELMRCVTMTPYSRAEYEQAWGKFRFRAGVPSVGVEAARMTLVRYWQSHGSTSVYKGGWKNDRAGREYAYDVRYWRQLPEWIAAAATRLKDAQIEQAPAVDVIRRFQHPEVLIYADPPYVISKRKGRQYVVDMVEDAEHIELLEALKDHTGPVILSGYDNELYPELWTLLLKWDNDSPVSFKPDGRTVHDYDRRFQLEDEGFIRADKRFFWRMLDEPLQLRMF